MMIPVHIFPLRLPITMKRFSPACVIAGASIMLVSFQSTFASSKSMPCAAMFLELLLSYSKVCVQKLELSIVNACLLILPEDGIFLQNTKAYFSNFVKKIKILKTY